MWIGCHSYAISARCNWNGWDVSIPLCTTILCVGAVRAWASAHATPVALTGAGAQRQLPHKLVFASTRPQRCRPIKQSDSTVRGESTGDPEDQRASDRAGEGASSQSNNNPLLANCRAHPYARTSADIAPWFSRNTQGTVRYPQTERGPKRVTAARAAPAQRGAAQRGNKSQDARAEAPFVTA